jgi:glyoxylase-like metal-dependent hydrolase (beta-lactamase superfamily II)
MRKRDFIGCALAALGIFTSALARAAPFEAPAPQPVIPGVWVIPGAFLPDRQPDGNSVIFDAPEGLIVVDSGRHAWHREAILSLARAQDKKIVAIVNTHWHLDHVSGNPDLRAAHPDLRVYASDAIDGALTGFFPASAKDSEAYLDDPQVPLATREDIRGDLLTMRNGAALKPDVVISTTRRLVLGGRALRINLAPDAVTAGDLWLYDEVNRLAVLGDLVTLPAPFLDTACPEGWARALAEIAATEFEVAIPGHGAPMDREQFQLYRNAFDTFIDCSNTARPEDECASRWADSIRPLLAGDPLGQKRAQGIAAYYVGMLRANGGRSKYCASQPSASDRA